MVNNRTQSIVSDDLGMSDHIIHAETRGESIDMKTKEKADLLEGMKVFSLKIFSSNRYKSFSKEMKVIIKIQQYLRFRHVNWSQVYTPDHVKSKKNTSSGKAMKYFIQLFFNILTKCTGDKKHYMNFY